MTLSYLSMMFLTPGAHGIQYRVWMMDYQIWTLYIIDHQKRERKLCTLYTSSWLRRQQGGRCTTMSCTIPWQQYSYLHQWLRRPFPLCDLYPHQDLERKDNHMRLWRTYMYMDLYTDYKFTHACTVVNISLTCHLQFRWYSTTIDSRFSHNKM